MKPETRPVAKTCKVSKGFAFLIQSLAFMAI